MEAKLSIGEIGTGTTCSNKGIDGKNIFNDENDYEQFMTIMGHYLVDYISVQKPGFKGEKKYLIEKKRRRNLAREVKLLAFCLLPNQYEILLIGPATKFIRRVCTHYSMYFNRKYKRRGPLFEGHCRMKSVAKDQISTIINKIHQSPGIRTVRRFGPIMTSIGVSATDYKYSSIVPKPWVTSILI